jgi:hypothetical protein
VARIKAEAAVVEAKAAEKKAEEDARVKAAAATVGRCILTSA